MISHVRWLPLIPLVAFGVLFTSSAGAVPSDYAHIVVQNGPGAVRVRVVKKSTGETVKDASILGLATVSIGPRGKPASMTTPILPIKDPKTGDFILKIEVGMVAHELQLTTKLPLEINSLVETVAVNGN